MTALYGVWLPIVTPFHDGAVDLASYERLVDHYVGQGVSGIFPLSTTGEGPAIDDDEAEAIVERTLAVVAGRVPVFVGVGGNITAKVVKLLHRLARYDFPGIVSVCPYYNPPTQDGLCEHFARIAEATDRQVRPQHPLSHRGKSEQRHARSPRRATQHCRGQGFCASLAQSLDLFRRRPPAFRS